MSKKRRNKKKTGRPSKLTPQLREKIVDLIKAGNFIDTTCATAGINKSTFYDWMKKGEESKQPNKYAKFYADVIQAKAWSEARDVTIINKHAETKWGAAAWMLERRFPEKWGKKKVILVSESKKTIDVNTLENKDIVIPMLLRWKTIRIKRGI